MFDWPDDRISEYLVETYSGVSPTPSNRLVYDRLAYRGGLMVREGGERAYYYCMRWLKENVAKEDGFIEIGSAWGASFHLWASVIRGPKISVDYIDMKSYPQFSRYRFNKRNKTWKKNFADVFPIYGKSCSARVINKVATILDGRKVGWLYIDGDHLYEGSEKDYSIYKQFVKPGGYIGFHDIADGERTPKGHNETCWATYNELSNLHVWQTIEGDGIGIIQCE